MSPPKLLKLAGESHIGDCLAGHNHNLHMELLHSVVDDEDERTPPYRTTHLTENVAASIMLIIALLIF